MGCMDCGLWTVDSGLWAVDCQACQNPNSQLFFGALSQFRMWPFPVDPQTRSSFIDSRLAAGRFAGWQGWVKCRRYGTSDFGVGTNPGSQ